MVVASPLTTSNERAVSSFRAVQKLAQVVDGAQEAVSQVFI